MWYFKSAGLQLETGTVDFHEADRQYIDAGAADVDPSNFLRGLDCGGTKDWSV